MQIAWKNLVFSKFWRITLSCAPNIYFLKKKKKKKKSLFKVNLYQILSKAMKFQQQIAGLSRDITKKIERGHIFDPNLPTKLWRV